MKFRESSMPDEAYWESLFDIDTILKRLGINGSLNDIVELGCGYGSFTIPVARCISGAMTTIDIDPDMVNRTARRGKEEGLSNVIVRHADIFSDGFCVSPESQDACLLFNILHGEEPMRLLCAAAQIVRPSGLVLTILIAEVLLFVRTVEIMGLGFGGART